jgi:hypothetical protein
VGDLVLVPRLGRPPGEGNSNPVQYSFLENPHGQRSLANYSPWGHKESDMTERLTHTHTQLIYNIMLVSSVQQSDLVTHMYVYIFILFLILFHYRLL